MRRGDKSSKALIYLSSRARVFSSILGTFPGVEGVLELFLGGVGGVVGLFWAVFLEQKALAGTDLAATGWFLFVPGTTAPK